MSIKTTIDNLDFTFEYADCTWTIATEYNFVEYYCLDAKFAPLKTHTPEQIRELLKYKAAWKLLDSEPGHRHIMISWNVPLLGMNIIVQLDKRQTSVSEDIDVRFKRQEVQVKKMEERHKKEVAALADELAKLKRQLELRDKRISMMIGYDDAKDDVWIKYSDNSPEAKVAYDAFINAWLDTIVQIDKDGKLMYGVVNLSNGQKLVNYERDIKKFLLTGGLLGKRIYKYNKDEKKFNGMLGSNKCTMINTTDSTSGLLYNVFKTHIDYFDDRDNSVGISIDMNYRKYKLSESYISYEIAPNGNEYSNTAYNKMDRNKYFPNCYDSNKFIPNYVLIDEIKCSYSGNHLYKVLWSPYNEKHDSRNSSKVWLIYEARILD